MRVLRRHGKPVLVGAALLSLTAAALAQTAASPAPAAAAAEAVKFDTGDTAWMLTSTALVLMMTIPGLALFYGGMVRKMNVLATVMQSFAITCLVTVLWMVIGYSIAFTGGNPVLRRAQPVHAGRHGDRRGQRPGQDDPQIGLHDVPDDLRDHHAGADLRRLRRSHEVLGAAVVHRAVVGAGLRADRALGLGAGRVSFQRRDSRFRRRHGGPHQCRRRRADGGAGARQAARLPAGADAAAQPRAEPDRRLAAVGRLVRVQCRLGGRRPTAMPAWRWR